MKVSSNLYSYHSILLQLTSRLSVKWKKSLYGGGSQRVLQANTHNSLGDAVGLDRMNLGI